MNFYFDNLCRLIYTGYGNAIFTVVHFPRFHRLTAEQKATPCPADLPTTSSG